MNDRPADRSSDTASTPTPSPTGRGGWEAPRLRRLARDHEIRCDASISHDCIFCNSTQTQTQTHTYTYVYGHVRKQQTDCAGTARRNPGRDIVLMLRAKNPVRGPRTVPGQCWRVWLQSWCVELVHSSHTHLLAAQDTHGIGSDTTAPVPLSWLKHVQLTGKGCGSKGGFFLLPYSHQPGCSLMPSCTDMGSRTTNTGK